MDGCSVPGPQCSLPTSISPKFHPKPLHCDLDHSEFLLTVWQRMFLSLFYCVVLLPSGTFFFFYLQCHIYIMKYYSAVRKKEIMSHVTWMDLESILLSEINQTEKDKYYMTFLTCGIWKGQVHRNRVGWWLPGSGEGEKWGDVGQSVKASSYKMKASLVVQRLRLCTSTAGVAGLIIGWESSACHEEQPKKEKSRWISSGNLTYNMVTIVKILYYTLEICWESGCGMFTAHQT